MNVPIAWLRVSRICGLARGVFETQDVELRSEHLVPLYTQDEKEEAIKRCEKDGYDNHGNP